MKNTQVIKCWFPRGLDEIRVNAQKHLSLHRPYKPMDTEEKQKNITFLRKTPSWTSKLGMSFLVSHGSEDLKGANSIYGNNIAYAIIVGQQGDDTQTDEL